MINFDDVRREARFHGDQHRSWLRRQWDDRPFAAALMMNPSVASDTIDDRTVRRVMGFADRNGCGGLYVVNLWSLITPKSAELWKAVNDIPPEMIEHNARAIEEVAALCELKIVAFGVHAGRRHRPHVDAMVGAFGSDLRCIGTSADGWPSHPMVRGKHRIPDTAPLVSWSLP